MERRSTSSSQEEQEKSLFLFVVVVGYIITFAMASNGGARYSVLQLLLDIFFGVIYLSLVFFEAEIVRHFSMGQRNALIFFYRALAGVRHRLVPGARWELLEAANQRKGIRTSINLIHRDYNHLKGWLLLPFGSCNLTCK